MVGEESTHDSTYTGVTPLAWGACQKFLPGPKGLHSLGVTVSFYAKKRGVTLHATSRHGDRFAMDAKGEGGCTSG